MAASWTLPKSLLEQVRSTPFEDRAIARVPIAEGNLHEDMNGGATTELTGPIRRCSVAACRRAPDPRELAMPNASGTPMATPAAKPAFVQFTREVRQHLNAASAVE
jgi:hypothetical protein